MTPLNLLLKTGKRNESPGLRVFLYENEDYSTYPVWIATFNYIKMDEVAKGHEGATIFFEFKKLAEGFKLYQVSTVP